MDTLAEQREFFLTQWPAMKQAVESGGGRAVVDFIQGRDDERERRVLYLFANQGLVMGSWEGKNFDDYITVVDAGIDELLRQAENADDEELRARYTDVANVISFNLAGDLADCWPGDDEPRERRHYERGLKAAEQCLAWREQLAKPPNPFSLAWWVKGIHQLGLGDSAGAAESWGRAHYYAVLDAKEQQQPTEVTEQTGFLVLISAGYLNLGRWIAGDDEGRGLYQQVIDCFTGQLADEERKDDAQFGIDQLEKVRARHVG